MSQLRSTSFRLISLSIGLAIVAAVYGYRDFPHSGLFGTIYFLPGIYVLAAILPSIRPRLRAGEYLALVLSVVPPSFILFLLGEMPLPAYGEMPLITWAISGAIPAVILLGILLGTFHYQVAGKRAWLLVAVAGAASQILAHLLAQIVTGDHSARDLLIVTSSNEAIPFPSRYAIWLCLVGEAILIQQRWLRLR